MVHARGTPNNRPERRSPGPLVTRAAGELGRHDVAVGLCGPLWRRRPHRLARVEKRQLHTRATVPFWAVTLSHTHLHCS